VDFYTLAIAALFVLALIDLSVGVSNDAVNFLNSAIGSRVARRRTILIVATFGIMIGALFSSGIMEVARKGIFNPDMFTFADVMIIFLAVMIADVLLLDLFNTLAMPTSTTVSIVFELLGAATAVAIIFNLNNPGSPPFFEFINITSALTIVGGIVLSVVVAFITGTIVQFFSRLLFTFQSNRRKWARIVWSAVALTVITDFLFVKGLKGTSFVSEELLGWVGSNAWPIMTGLFLFWLCFSLILEQMKRNPLAFVVLAGTFSLAMAFASNDLVNFIGVPLAGMESFRSWSASGLPPAEFMMDSLKEPVKGDTIYLIGAGIVMASTLWLSSRARSVTQTEVTLSRQFEGAERFQPGAVSRTLVRGFISAGAGLRAITPEPWQTKVASRFEHEAQAVSQHEAPAFDLVRASVNLVVASILIAIATSMKLPLSTTFVSFMVAMGTSLADRAWGRDSAAYRVAGVLSVLSGWFITAIAAFTMAAIFATLLSYYEMAALIGLLLFIAFSLYRTFHYHGLRAVAESRIYATYPNQFEHQVHLLQLQMSELLEQCSETLDLAIRGLLDNNRVTLELATKSSADLKRSCARKELIFVRVMKRVKPDVDDQLLGSLEALACQQDFYQSVSTVVDTVSSHILNSHERLTPRIRDLLVRFNEQQAGMIKSQVRLWEEGQLDEELDHHIRSLERILSKASEITVQELYDDIRPVKYTTLMLTLLTELQDIVRELDRARLIWDVHMGPSQAPGSSASDPMTPQPAPSSP